MASGTAGVPVRRRVFGVLLAAAAASIILPVLTTSPGAAQPVEAFALTLVDQTYSVAPGDELRFELTLDGALPTQALPTTTTTTTTTTQPAPSTGDRDRPPPRRPGTTVGRSTTSRPTTTTATTSAPTTTSTTPATEPLPNIDGDITVVVYPPVLDRAGVDLALDGELGEPTDGVQLMPLADSISVRSAYDRDDDVVELSVRLPTSSGVSGADDLDLPSPGIYPVAIAVRLDGETVAEHVTLVRRVPDPGTAPQLRLGVLAGAMDDDDGPALAELTDLATADFPVTAAIDPELLTTTVEQDPRTITALAGALTGDESVALPTGDLDASSAATADLGELFYRHLRAGEDVLLRQLPETPVRRTVWPITDEPISTGGGELLTRSGTRLFIIPPDLATSLVGTTEVPVGQHLRTPLGADEASSVIVDDDIANLLEPNTDTADDLEDSVRMLSWMLVEAGSGERRGVVLATADFGVPDRSVLSEMAGLADEAADVEFVTVSALPGVTDENLSVDVTLPPTSGTDMRPRVTTVARVRLSLADTSSMLPRGDRRPLAWNQRLDELLTTVVDDDAAQAVIDELEAAARTIRAAIVPPDPFSFTLTGRESELQVRLTNAGSTPLRVVVAPSSPRLTFPSGPQTVELGAGVTQFVPIDVAARANGTTSVSISIRTPSGVDVVRPVVLTAHVRALTGVGQVITGGAVVVLATWWVSHLRQRRRQRRATVAVGRHPASQAAAPGSIDRS